jgi:alpha-mannosidase
MEFSAILQSLIKNLRQYGVLNILPNWQTVSLANYLGSSSSESQDDFFKFPSDGKFDPEITQVILSQSFQLPQKLKSLNLEDVRLRLSLVWWADLAEVSVNGIKVVEGDLFDQKCRILLSENVSPGERFDIEIKLWKPKHDRLGFTTSEILIEYPHTACDPGKLAIELEILLALLPNFEKEDLDLGSILNPFLDRLNKFCETAFSLADLEELAEIRSLLLPLSEFFKQRKVYILGNSHIDIAWLWAIAETKEVMNRTFNSTLELQEQYPELIFNQSTALSYQWMEREYPQLFEQIKQAIANQKWEPIGGMWVEPDCNIPSGESLIRQILYGKAYFQSQFNYDVKIAWLPDTFGFNWQLPQILVKSGFTAFITQKLTWNDTNKFPHSLFWWEGVDGSCILSYFCNPLGMGIEPVAIAKHLITQEQNHGMGECLWLYGVGDHGGGVTADMLDLGREWNQSPLFFELIPSTAADFIEKIEKKIEVEKIELPVWQDELYLEFHRGTYTSKADQKLKNRHAEILLTNLEKLYAIACIRKTQIYPQLQLDRAWQLLLTNQFHDILPGTAIPEVFADADLGWQEIDQIGKDLFATFQPNHFYSQQFCLWNPLNWQRSELIELNKSLFDPNIDWQNSNLAIIQDNSQVIPLQQTDSSILFFANDLASFTATTFEFTEQEVLSKIKSPILKITLQCLENQFLRIAIDSYTGEISQIFDYRSGKNLLSDRLQLQFFEDRGQYWDAWNIDPDYQKHQLEPATLQSISIKEKGDLRVSLEVISRFRNSTIKQEYQLDIYNHYLTIKTQIDWQESHILVKAAFPVSFEGEATYEIPMATITRSTRAETPEAKAKFEVPAQFWADLSSNGIGLSVLNDCKYGYDSLPNCLRLTLLRSPEWTCPASDRTIHNFSYRLIPHQGDWREAGIVRAGYQFNIPPLMLCKTIPDYLSTANFITVSESNIIVSAFKRSHTNPNLWILRCYESEGKEVLANFEIVPTISSLKLLDLIEHEIESLTYYSHSFSTTFLPYEIKTFGLEFG